MSEKTTPQELEKKYLDEYAQIFGEQPNPIPADFSEYFDSGGYFYDEMFPYHKQEKGIVMTDENFSLNSHAKLG